MENADTGYHQHSHRRSNYSRSNELHVEKAARKKRKPPSKGGKKIKALKEAKASSKHKDAFSLFSGLFLYIESFKVVLVWAECPKATYSSTLFII